MSRQKRGQTFRQVPKDLQFCICDKQNSKSMDKGTIFSGQPVEKRGFHETLRNELDHDKPFLSDTYGHRAQSEKK